jgi:non-lysosomal glucosylceramidase
VVLQDRDFLDAVWPTIPVALEYVRGFDTDGDGLLDHFGADQTYDTWSMLGASAYTAGLLIAALEAASEMARVQGRPDLVERYMEWLGLARRSVQDKLWNGRYFRYNTGQNPQRESSLADQLAGQWYTGALGLPGVAPREQVVSALKSVFELNVMQFGGGALGAVNGMQPDGRPDETDMQSREVWSGVTYALAAMMLQEGLDREAWQTAWGVYHVTYVSGGFWFRTPEAWTADLSFRASMYMRPQSIWAIEHALRVRRNGV